MKKIIVWVISAHLAIVGLLCASRRVTQENPYTSISIQTVVLQPQPQHQHQTTLVTKKNSTPTPKAQPIKKKPSKDHNALAQLMRESLQTLDQSAPPTSKTTVPKKIGKLATEALTFETNYASELIAYLQELLTLPEEGEVKLQLTLKRQGSVESLTIQSASSAKNRTYVEQTLTTLALPPFGHHFKGEEHHCFTIRLETSTMWGNQEKS